MAKVALFQESFTGGEMAPAARGRKRFEKYGSSLARQENLITGDKGQLLRRMGFRYVNETKDNGQAVLIEFEFNTSQTYILEFGENYMRVYKDEARLGAPYEISTPYTYEQIKDAWYRQINDIVYIATPEAPLYKLSRTGDTSWSIDEVVFIDGPYLPKNKSGDTATYNSGAGTVTFSATTNINDGDGLQSTDVDALIRIEDGSKYNVFRIDSVTSTTVCDVTEIYESNAGGVTSTTAYTDWRISDFTGTRGYATHVGMFDSRLCLVGNSRIHLSQINDLENFSTTDVEDATIVPDNAAISRPLNDQNPVQWIYEGKTLQVGTSSQEYQLKPASISDPLSPDNNTLESQGTSVGGAKVRPANAQATIFVQRSKRKMFDFAYSFQNDSFVARNIMVLSDHIAKDGGGIEEVVYAKEPNSVIYGRCSDGTMFAGTYIREQSLVNFYKLPLEQGIKIVSMAVITSPDESESQLWAVLEYSSGGSTKRSVCYMEKDFYPSSETDKSEFHFFDLMKTYTNQTSTTLTGLDHIEGMTVRAIVDGVAQPEQVVASGQVVYDDIDTDNGSIVHIGIPYFPLLEILVPEGGNPLGTAHGKKKKYPKASLAVLNTIGYSIGSNDSDLTKQEFRNISPPETGGESPNLFTGDTPDVLVKTGYTRNPKMVIKQEDPYPITILNVYLDVFVTER